MSQKSFFKRSQTLAGGEQAASEKTPSIKTQNATENAPCTDKTIKSGPKEKNPQKCAKTAKSPQINNEGRKQMRLHFDRIVEDYIKQKEWDHKKPSNTREFLRTTECRQIIYQHIKSLMQADVANDALKMHDIISVLLSMKVITIFQLLHLDYSLDQLNDIAQFHGDKSLVRFFLAHIIQAPKEMQTISHMAHWVKDILYVTSHQAWANLFAAYTLPNTFPPKTLALCKIRTLPHSWLLPIQEEVLKYGVECATNVHGPLSITKKRPRPGIQNEKRILEQSIIRQAAKTYSSFPENNHCLIHEEGSSKPNEAIKMSDEESKQVFLNGFYGQHQLISSRMMTEDINNKLSKINIQLQAINEKLTRHQQIISKDQTHAGSPSKNIKPLDIHVKKLNFDMNKNQIVQQDQKLIHSIQQPEYESVSERPSKNNERSRSNIDNCNSDQIRTDIAQLCQPHPAPHQQDLQMQSAYEKIPIPTDTVQERMHKNTFWHQNSNASDNTFNLLRTPCHNHLRNICRLGNQCNRSHINLPHHNHNCCSFYNHLSCHFGQTCRRQHHESCMRETQKILQSAGISSQQLFSKNPVQNNPANNQGNQFNY